MPFTQLADGSTSAYGFACGYQDVADFGDIRVRLYMEHGTYHVRLFNHAKNEQVWNTTRSLRLARSLYAQRVREARHATDGHTASGA